MKNWNNLEARKAPIKIPHYKIELEGGTTYKSKKKIDYEYYVCDYCGEHIKIEKDIEKRIGGIVRIPITSHKNLVLALHNRCLKSTLAEINKIYGINV